MSVLNKSLLVAPLTFGVLGLGWSASAPAARTGACHRYSSRGGTDARAIARSSELAAELVGTEHGGRFSLVSPRALRSLVHSIPIDAGQARQADERAFLQSASGTSSAYVVVARSLSGDTYAIRRRSSGTIVRSAMVCGARRTW